MIQSIPRASLLIALVLLVACCGPALRPDPVMPAIEANYPTAEIIACGKRWHGLGACSLVTGSEYNSVGMSVQVYHEGTLTITSTDCQLDTELTYQGTQLVPVRIPGVADRNCLVSVTVSPKYPNQDEQSIRVYSFRGHLAVRVLANDKEEWRGFTRKVTGNFSSDFKVWVGGAKPIRMVADGCARRNPYDKRLNLTEGYLLFDLADILPSGLDPKVCVLEGFIASEYPDLLFNVMVSKYDTAFSPLPIPAIEVQGSKIEIVADDAVSIVAFDERFKVDREANFDGFDPSRPHVIRLLTVGGRSAIGEWDTKKRDWLWMK